MTQLKNKGKVSYVLPNIPFLLDSSFKAEFKYSDEPIHQLSSVLMYWIKELQKYAEGTEN